MGAKCGAKIVVFSASVQKIGIFVYTRSDRGSVEVTVGQCGGGRVTRTRGRRR